MREIIDAYSLDLWRKIKKKNSDIWDEKKMSKTIEYNKQKTTIKRLAWEFNLYRKFICTDKNNDKNKTN